MGEILGSDESDRKRKRLAERADQMVKSGRLTEEEAERVRSADKPGEIEDVIRNIRIRHAGTKLGAAVADGSLSREAADGFLERLRKGEHSAALRGALRKLRPGAGTLPRPQDDPRGDTSAM